MSIDEGGELEPITLTDEEIALASGEEYEDDASDDASDTAKPNGELSADDDTDDESVDKDVESAGESTEGGESAESADDADDTAGDEGKDGDAGSSKDGVAAAGDASKPARRFGEPVDVQYYIQEGYPAQVVGLAENQKMLQEYLEVAVPENEALRQEVAELKERMRFEDHQAGLREFDLACDKLGGDLGDSKKGLSKAAVEKRSTLLKSAEIVYTKMKKDGNNPLLEELVHKANLLAFPDQVLKSARDEAGNRIRKQAARRRGAGRVPGTVDVAVENKSPAAQIAAIPEIAEFWNSNQI